MLSSKGIRDCMAAGLLAVEPAGDIGPASVDLHVGGSLYRYDTQAHLRYYQEVSRLARPGTFPEMIGELEWPDILPFEEYVRLFGRQVDDDNGCWTLEPGIYYAQTAERITTRRGVRIGLATRSSSARTGLRVQHSEHSLDRGKAFDGRPFLVIQSHGHVELPMNYGICQMVVEPLPYLQYWEIAEAMERGQISVSGGAAIEADTDSIILTFHPKMLRYNGRTLNPVKDSSGCFEEIDISNGYMLETGRFYLGSTREAVGIGNGYVGVLHERSGFFHRHLNSPYHWPGSRHHITLEIVSQQPMPVKAGDPACRLFIERLYPECEAAYNSRYKGQQGPTVSRVV